MMKRILSIAAVALLAVSCHSHSQCMTYYAEAIHRIKTDSTALAEFCSDGDCSQVSMAVYDSTVSAVGSAGSDKMLCDILYGSLSVDIAGLCDSLKQAGLSRRETILKEYKQELSRLPDDKEFSAIAYIHDYNDSILIVALMENNTFVPEHNYRDMVKFSTQIYYVFLHRDCKIIGMYIDGPWYW